MYLYPNGGGRKMAAPLALIRSPREGARGQALSFKTGPCPNYTDISIVTNGSTTSSWAGLGVHGGVCRGADKASSHLHHHLC